MHKGEAGGPGQGGQCPVHGLDVHRQHPSSQVKITSHKQSAFVNRSQVLLTGTVSNQRAKIVVNGIIAAVDAACSAPG